MAMTKSSSLMQLAGVSVNSNLKASDFDRIKISSTPLPAVLTSMLCLIDSFGLTQTISSE